MHKAKGNNTTHCQMKLTLACIKIQVVNEQVICRSKRAANAANNNAIILKPASVLTTTQKIATS